MPNGWKFVCGLFATSFLCLFFLFEETFFFTSELESLYFYFVEEKMELFFMLRQILGYSLTTP